jgi:CAAX protease family protein
VHDENRDVPDPVEGGSTSLGSVTPPPAVPPSQSSMLSTIFFGINGLRSGWRLLLFLIITFVLISVFRLGLRPVVHGLKVQVWLLFIGESESLASVLLAAFIMSRIERRAFASYGLPRQSAFGKLFWAGVLWGVVSLTILLLAIHGLGGFSIGGLAVHGARIAKFACFYGLLFLFVGFFEEFSFRGYMQFTLTQGIGFWPAAILLSVLFGALHLGNHGEAWIGALSAALIGFFFCLTLRRTGTLWFAVGLHAAWDWSESFLYSVPDSGLKVPGHLLNTSFHGSRWITGGTVGPEGSVFVLILIGAMWLLFNIMYPEVKYSPETSSGTSLSTTSAGTAVQP